MIDAYFDSAIIVKLYVHEATSPEAIRLVSEFSAPYILTSWQALEVRNAIRLKAFRREITSAEMTQSLVALDEDIASGRWLNPGYDIEKAELKTGELSALYTANMGCRTLDIIHVAIAVLLTAKAFVTFDRRQKTLALASGLLVQP